MNSYRIKQKGTKVGRPKLYENKDRRYIQLFVTDEFHSKLSETCKILQMTLSTFIREAVREKINRIRLEEKSNEENKG